MNNRFLNIIPRPGNVKLLRTAVTLFVLLIIHLFIYSQSGSIGFQSLPAELSNKFVRCIVKDSESFMWFGTFNGLNKYDGTNVSIYTNDPADTTSLSNNTINAIYEDNTGNLWIATTSGLNIYNRNQDNFFNANNIPGVKNQFEFACITALCPDSRKNIWIGTLGGGIGIFNSGKNRFDNFYLSGPAERGSDIDYINCLVPEEGNNIWIGTRNGLHLVNAVSHNTKEFHKSGTVIDLSDCNISYMIKDNANSYWVVTSDYGLLLLTKNESNRYDITRFSEYTGLDILSGKEIKTLFSHGHNELWIGTENEGLIILNKQTKKVRTYLPEEGNPKSISSNSIWSIYIDNEERAWIGSYNKGIDVIDKFNNRFESYLRNPFRKISLADNDVTAFTTDNQGNLWIGTDGGGISIFDIKTSEFTRIINNKSDQPKLLNNVIKCLLTDSENNIWAGTWGDGIEKINPYKKQVHSYPVMAGGVGDNNLLCLFEDKGGNIWAGTAGSGLFLLDRKQNKFIQKIEEENEIGVPSFAFVSSIYEDHSGRFWVGTLYGLYLYIPDGKGKYLKKTFFQNEEEGSISSERIQTIFEDKKRNIWIGTLDNGLNLYLSKTSSFRPYQKKDGLASNMIQSILEDASGNLWISSDNGITKFNPKTSTSKTYSGSTDLLSDAFYASSCFKTTGGKFFFGSDMGFNAFHPDSVSDNPVKPLVHFTGFKINNEPVKKYGENHLLKQHIDKTDEIVLNYKQTTFTIEFVGISYTRPAKNIYRYRMTGFNDEWNYIDHKTEVTFTGLEQGKYTFVVEAANNDGIWCESPASVDVIIKPPFWKTWWAYTIYILFILFMIMLVFRIRFERIRMQNDLKMERLKHEKEHELDQYKMQFFTNISHEFRTPLSLIIAPLENLMSSVQLTGEIKQKVHSAFKNTKRLMRLVNELMDFRKIDNRKMRLHIQQGDIVKFIEDIYESLQEIASKRNITFTIRPESPVMEGWFDYNALEKILLNLLSNAFKYTPDKGYIEINIFKSTGEQNKKFISVTVSDNGKGISEEDMPFIFERFYQAKSSMSSGTGIGLALVKSLVELHHGSIQAESIPNEKTSFTVNIPCEKEAYASDEFTDSPVNIIKEEYDFEPTGEEPEKVFVGNTHKKKSEILIVEDNIELLKYIENELKQDYKVSTAKNGKEGIRAAQEIIPDLIISDVVMPEISGIELCHVLKTDMKTSHIPVILLTAKASLEDQVEGLQSKADAYITKPFSIHYLRAQIEQLLANRESLYKVFSKEVHIVPGKIAQNEIDKEFLKITIDYILKNITNNQLSVEDIATAMHLSRGQFYKKIKALSGQTAVEFVRGIRLKEAVKLMETRKYTLAEISYQTGFNTPSYFTRSFKEYYGKAPSDYLNKTD